MRTVVSQRRRWIGVVLLAGGLVGILSAVAGAAPSGQARADRPPATIAYIVRNVKGTQLWLMNVDTRRPRQLTHGAVQPDLPAWSPNGRAIAVSRTLQRGGTTALAIVSLPGGRVRTITNGAALDEDPSWSPGGGRLAFTRTLMGGGTETTWPGIWVARANGSGARQLTRSPFGDTTPAWSPHGNAIVFTRARDRSGLHSDVWTMHPDGRSAHRLVRNARRPAWSPDGSRIVFGHLTGKVVGCCPATDVFVMAANGAQPRLVVRNAAHPDWSPDGKMIVFQRPDGARAHLWVVNLDGTGLRQLTSRPASQWAPAWQPG